MQFITSEGATPPPPPTSSWTQSLHDAAEFAAFSVFTHLHNPFTANQTLFAASALLKRELISVANFPQPVDLDQSFS